MTNQTTIELIKNEEGFKNIAYKDVAGLWTTGVGHLIKPNEQHLIKDVLSNEQVNELLRSDLMPIEACINKLIKVDLNQNQFDALSSLMFNIGISAFSSSTLLKLINSQGKKEEIKAAFEAWSKATVKGKKVTVQALLNRRKRESEIYFL